MAEVCNRKRTRLRRWRYWTFAVGGSAAAAFAFYMAAVNRVSLERAADADAPVQEKTAFEPTDWRVGPVALVYVGTLVLIVVCCFVLIAAYPNALPDVDRTLTISPPGPRLQTNPQADLERFRAEDAGRLNGYYWIDRQKGIVHIPVEQAMQKLARTGIPGFARAQQQ